MGIPVKENRTEVGFRHGLRMYVGSIGHKAENKQGESDD